MDSRVFHRRNFLKKGALLAGVGAGAAITGSVSASTQHALMEQGNDGETILYNGIHLPGTWPPNNMRPGSYDPMPIPYLTETPAVIPIDLGRQLFVDDFLIEQTDLERKFHQPVKYHANPLLRPTTAMEMNKGYCPVAAPFSDGCFYDPADRLYKLWYMAGWFDGTALATSKDGIHWERQVYDVVPGTNLVLPAMNCLRRDGASVWLDHEAKDEQERFKMYLYARQGDIGGKLDPYGAFLLKSSDGIHWQWGGRIIGGNDNNTFFYNPFRKKWVFSLRKESRPVPPWSQPLKTGAGRARSYWEHDSWDAALDQWKGSVFWFGADRHDRKKIGYPIGDEPQIYKVDAVAYESLMIGLIQVHYGPANEHCAETGIPKLTELQLAFSRDGFHWDRSCRKSFISAYPNEKENWERAYIHSIGGVCLIVNDQLYFYYTAFKGDESNRNKIQDWNGMYANASMGLATLRRDGFASMETAIEGTLLTRPLLFTGQYFFVNVDSTSGSVAVEICELDGRPIMGYTKDTCYPIAVNSTKYAVKWQERNTVAELSGKKIRIRFYVNRAKIYSFWVSQKAGGESGGATAAGGPGFTGTWDH